MRNNATAIGLICAVASGAAIAANGVTVTTVFRPSDPVPGMPGFTMVGVGGNASINDAGVVLYTATITGDGIGSFNDHVLIGGPIDSLSLIGREREPIPTLPGYIYLAGSANLSGFFSLAVTPGGDIGYQPTIFETGVSTTWLNSAFAGPISTPAPAIRQSGPGPGFAAAYSVAAVSRVAYADGGRAAVTGRVVGPSVEYVCWAGDPVNGMSIAVRSNAQAPGMPAGVNVNLIRDNSVRMNNQGRIALLTLLHTGVGGVTTSNRDLWYEGLPGALGILARRADPVPGLPGASYSQFDEYKMRLNAAGDLCFATQLVGGGTDAALMLRSNGVLAPLVKDGDPAPGLPGLSLDGLYSNDFDLNGMGRVAFVAKLVGAPADSDSALFVGEPGDLRVAFREGDPLPGGHTTPDLQSSDFFFNDRDQIVVGFIVDGRGAFFATRPNGEMLKLARGTEPFFTDDGFSGVPGALVPWRYDSNASAIGSGGPSVFNNEGQFVLSMFFTGSTGSAIVLFDIDDPCPADLALPFGLLDLSDINAFVAGFTGMTANGDLDGNGLWELADINIFVGSFTAGCP